MSQFSTTTSRQANNSILFITLSNIGDAVMTTPVLQSLHRLFPEAVIDIVVDRRSRELFEYCPYRGSLFEKNKKDFLRGTPGLVLKLRKKKYRLIVDLRTGFLPLFLRADMKLGKHDRSSVATHSVEKHLSVIRPIAGNSVLDRCCLWVSETERHYAEKILAPSAVEKYLCIAPGANAAKKIWNWQRFQQLIERLSGHFHKVLLLGGWKDRQPAGQIMSQLRTPALNLCGETTLLQAAAILQHADLFIGNDSGLGHMAAAAGVPTCTLFGPGQPEKYRPWGESATWIVGENREINTISVEQVVKTLKKNNQLPCNKEGTQ